MSGTKRGTEKWAYGYVRRNKAGKPSYVIYQKVLGRVYEVSTRAKTEAAAEAEYRRFEADRDAYSPGGPKKPDGVYLTPDLATEFLTWSAAPKEEGGKGNGARWVHYQSKYLVWWEPHLKGIDLRNAPIEKIEGPLKDTPSRPHKIEAIKALYSWLVTVRRAIKPTEDPTYRTLKVPQAKAAQLKKKKAMAPADYFELRSKLVKLSTTLSKAGRPVFSPYWIDCLDVLAGTGWHVSELERFSSEGTIQKVDHKDGAAILEVIHKSGSVHRTLVSKPVFEAAKRIRDRATEAAPRHEEAKRRERKTPAVRPFVPREGTFKGDALRTALQRACDALEIPRLHPGSFRHSIATHAIDQGAEIKATSDFLGHKSSQTTKKFYATFAVPSKVPTFT